MKRNIFFIGIILSLSITSFSQVLSNSWPDSISILQEQFKLNQRLVTGATCLLGGTTLVYVGRQITGGKIETTYRLLIVVVVVFSINVASCSVNWLTQEEKIIVEKYTKDKNHDVLIIGEWINNETWEQKGKTNRDDISFDEQGTRRGRMYRDGEPLHDWQHPYYYYTENDTIFMYRPEEKGIWSMDGEIFLQAEYQVSEDGETLYLGDKSYQKRK